MALYRIGEQSGSLAIPESLQTRGDQALPEVNDEVVRSLHAGGWQRIGIMVAVIEPAGNILMLKHHAREKNKQDMLGPLGETSQWTPKTREFEQPLATLRRGIMEELGFRRPEDLELSMFPSGGWAINQWPRGTELPGQFACAISFPIFIGDKTRQAIVDLQHEGEEVGASCFMPASEVLSTDEAQLRPGVKPWLEQLGALGLLQASAGDLTAIDFSAVPIPENVHVGSEDWR